MKWIGSVCLTLLIAGCGGTESRPRTVTELEADSAVLPGLIPRAASETILAVFLVLGVLLLIGLGFAEELQSVAHDWQWRYRRMRR